MRLNTVFQERKCKFIGKFKAHSKNTISLRFIVDKVVVTLRIKF